MQLNINFLFHILFHYGLSQVLTIIPSLSSGTLFLSILSIIVHTRWPLTLNSSLLCFGNQTPVLYVCESLSIRQVGSSMLHFSFHIEEVMSYGVCLSY